MAADYKRIEALLEDVKSSLLNVETKVEEVAGAFYGGNGLVEALRIASEQCNYRSDVRARLRAMAEELEGML